MTHCKTWGIIIMSNYARRHLRVRRKGRKSMIALYYGIAVLFAAAASVLQIGVRKNQKIEKLPGPQNKYHFL